MSKINEKGKTSKSNTKNSQKMLITIVVVFLICIAIAGIAFTFSGDDKKSIPAEKNKDGISVELVKDKTYEGLTFKNINIETREKITVLTANVENKNETSFEEGAVNIVFYDANEKKIGTQEASMTSIPGKGSIRIEVVIDAKYKDANNLKIEKIN